MDFHQYTKKSRYEDLENYDTSNFECGDDDNDFVDEKLIIEIKARPCLYDKNTKIQERDKAWSDVAKSLDKSVEFCQYRWRRLKQYFSKERQKRDLCEPSKTSFKFYHKMLFMDAHIYKRKTLRKRQFPKVDNTDKVSIAEVDDTKVRSNDSILASFLEKEVSIKQQSFDVSSDEESSVLVNQCIRNNLITKEMANIELSHSDNNSKDNNSDAVDYSAQSRAGYNFSSRYGNKEHPTFNNISNIKSLTPTVSLNNENKDVQSLQLQTLVQDEFQSILSKLDGIDYKNLNDPKKDEENSVIAKLIVTKLKKIDQNTKTKFKFACMKILYLNN